MAPQPQTFGTLLRHLLDLVDGGIEASYRELGLDYRPRYTPIVRVLRQRGPTAIRTLAQEAGITHSAASQTVAHMARAGLVRLGPGQDARERIVSAAEKLVAMAPTLDRQWRANNAAAAEIDAELSAPLSALLAEAIAALERRPLQGRVARLAQALEADG